ncbi:hypothetical protein CONLIGDRAFT_629452 [Coniochaeta ligniaria NRRL 30616]|uniref:Uncharacterized protein n=1 Tax=Coniochaeta ligniaria NRRL 30616 TaxID=1408157 RepID=A0A1J7JEL7_9PEZI|nr:hypothetical protein CONLIGDRAFT_629452 [Coniochaeta ligniaria NRRL 30616]
MAQTQLLSMPHTAMAGSFTAEELHEIHECERLVRFRDEVLSGAHPRIKPAHLAAKTVSRDSRSSSSTALPSAVSPPAFHSTKVQAGATGSRQTAVNPEQSAHSNIAQTALQSFSVNSSQAVPGLGSLPNGAKAMASSARPFAPSGSTEINPVLLEKSADLVKAERHLKRQRLERSLRDEMDQRRVSAKTTLQPSEVLPDFDLADVLSKAQALVKPASPQPTDDTAANASASSDSFDDNTFYSSQHDTPEFLEEESRLLHKSPEDVEMREESPYEPQFEAEPIAQPIAPQIPESNIPKRVESNAPMQNNPPHANIPTGPRAERMNGLEPRQNMPPRIPGLQTVQPFEGRISLHTAAETSYSAGLGNVGGQQAVNQPQLSAVNSAPLGESLGRQPSPLVRAHNLSPIAPQPAHVSPLAVARQPPAAQIDDGVRTGTPAQVAALRKQPSAASSPDGSPRDSGATEKKQKKKKKRRSERLAAESGATTASPYIKPEPRSPSPIVAPSYARPNKRLRQEQRQPGGLDYGEARYDQPPRAEEGYVPRYEQGRTYVEERYPPSQHPQFAEDLRPRQAPPSFITSGSRIEREYYEPGRPSPAALYHRPASPGSVFPGHYMPGQVRQARSVSHAVLEGSYREGPVAIQYNAAREGRMSVRPAADRERSRSPVAYERHASVMPPPRAPVRRIIVDEYGREYIEPSRPAPVIRASEAPGARLEEPEIIYERTVPARAVSRRPDIYEDASMYGQPAPSYPPTSAPYARRVVTQPELTGPDYRAYRERDYPPRPMARHPDEMLPPRAVEVPREYVARAASVRPASEAYQYDLPVGYQRRIVEEVPREYASVRAGSVRPVDGQRYEVRHGYERLREYSAVPARTASVRPAEPMQYGEVVRGDQGWRVGSVRPEVREYAPSAALPGAHREMLPPAAPGRAYSVRPGEAASPVALRQQEYQQPALRPADGYYGQAHVRQGEEEVTYVDQVPRQDAYGGQRRH